MRLHKIFVLTFIFVCIFILLRFQKIFFSYQDIEIPNKPDPKKLILSWTNFFGISLDEKYFKSCPQMLSICEISTNRSRHSEADALVFHPPDMNWNDIPAHRTLDQRYVFLMHESPTSMLVPNLDEKLDFFNWTMTYRMDSDVPYSYKFLSKNSSASIILDTSAILNKSHGIVWFVSKCVTASLREQYVHQLQKYIQIDIYGECGQFKCPKGVDKFGYSMVSPCERELIDQKYKFYIAFENSNCQDYVTEKFFSRYQFNAVPLVLSRKTVQHILPHGSYIAADDFKGPAQLGQHLKMLMENETEYLKYFEWKRIGYSESNTDPKTGMEFGFCGLCQKLWRNEKIKSYRSMQDWWGEKAACDNGLAVRLVNFKV